MDKLREEFEQWFLSEMEIDVSGMRNEDTSTSAEWPYTTGEDESSTVITVAFKAWQASRASIFVALPDSVGIECNVCADVAIKRCEESIRSIGLSIKGE
ncbi:hypothetical protein [Serratia marcescens]|uniref:hypothetical protein n=1 Tax=Serratia marcescens TaxID=615 RepID=UPI003988D22F